MSENDLELEPMHRGRLRPVLITAGVLLVGAFAAHRVHDWFATARRGEQLRRTSTAWNELRHCLVGDGPPEGERASTVVRRTEIGQPASVRALPPAERIRQWPYRCATHASVMTHALFEADSDDPQHRMLAMLASRAASALEEARLRTGAHERLSYIDELFETARRAQLPPGDPASGPPPPPPPPARPLTARALTPLFSGSGTGTVLGSDPVASRTLRVLFGESQRQLCVLRPSTNPRASLSTAQCRELPFADAPARVELPAATDDAPPMVRVRRADAAEGTGADLYALSSSTEPLHRGGLGTFVDGEGRARVLLRDPSSASSWRLASIAANAPASTQPLRLPFDTTAPAPVALVLEREVFAIGRTGSVATRARPDAGALAPDAGPDGGSLASEAIERAATVLTTSNPRTHDIGPVPAPGGAAGVRACRAGETLAVAVFGEGDRAAVMFQRDGRWSPPVSTTARAGAFTCRDGEATVTWTETAPRRLVHQVRCTARGCQGAEGPLPDFGAEPAVTDLDGRVLLLVSPGPGRGLWMRLAPLERLADAPDVVLVDDAEHGGLHLNADVRPFVRGNTAVVFVTAAGEQHATYALRIAADGVFSAVTPR
jgi:hypothetical protein